MTRKSRLPAPKFAFAQKHSDGSQSDAINSDPEISPISSKSSEIVNELPKSNTSAKVDYTRITTQLISLNDRKLEYASFILGKKKQDLINELLSNGLDSLNIAFPQL
jgi:hypothetical protein